MPGASVDEDSRGRQLFLLTLTLIHHAFLVSRFCGCRWLLPCAVYFQSSSTAIDSPCCEVTIYEYMATSWQRWR